MGAKTTLICTGQTGFTETLPAGKTEKGMWVAASFAGGLVGQGVSFNIPLSAAPAVHYIDVAKKELTATGEQPSTVCTGSAANPTAPDNALCVYAHLEKDASTEATFNEFFFAGWKWGVIVDTEGGEGGAGGIANTAAAFGFDISALGKEAESVATNGSWAVTG